MKFAICDDNSTCDMIKEYITRFCFLRNMDRQQIDSFNSVTKMLECSVKYDVAFINIKIMKKSVIAIAHALRDKNRNILLFISIGHDFIYFDETLENDGYRYLKKPIFELRLCNSLKLAFDKSINANLKICIETKDGTFVVLANDIVMVRTEKRKTIVQTVVKEYVTDKRIVDWREMLPKSLFMETFKGVIVGFEHILSYTEDIIKMDIAGAQAYVSTRKYSEFKARYAEFLEKW